MAIAYKIGIGRCAITCIAGYRDDDGVVGLVCDSAVTTQAFKFLSGTPKIFEAGALCYGVAGVFPPVLRTKNYPGTLAGVRKLAMDIYNSMVKHNHGGVDEDAVFTVPITAIIIGPGIGPFLMGPCGEIIEAASGFHATGSGGAAAMGAMFVAKDLQSNAETALTFALEAAISLDPFTGGPGIMRLLSPVEARPKRVRARKEKI